MLSVKRACPVGMECCWLVRQFLLEFSYLASHFIHYPTSVCFISELALADNRIGRMVIILYIFRGSKRGKGRFQVSLNLSGAGMVPS